MPRKRCALHHVEVQMMRRSSFDTATSPRGKQFEDVDIDVRRERSAGFASPPPPYAAFRLFITILRCRFAPDDPMLMRVDDDDVQRYASHICSAH